MIALSYRVPHYKVRLVRDRVYRYPVESVGCASDSVEVFRKLFGSRPHEELAALYLNGRNAIIGTQILAVGGLHGCSLLPRDIFRGALETGASALILSHTHPSGDPRPSREDIDLTRHAIKAGELLGVTVLDHVIVTAFDGPWVSMRELGLFD